MAKSPTEAALELAAAPTLARMRSDGDALPPRLRPIMAYVIKHLFDTDLGATRAWNKSGIRGHSRSSEFCAVVGVTLRVYIERRRLEIADRMVRNSPHLEIGRISLAVGYDYHSTFAEAYEKWLGEVPKVARRKPSPPEMEYQLWRQWMRAELDDETAWGVLKTALELYPSLEGRLREHYGEGSPIEVDGGRYEQWMAEELWRDLRRLPFEAQGRLVGHRRFHTSALFDLLRKKSREEGRKDRQRGIELAELALASLEGCEKIFGERLHELRALGHAWLGNAHRLAFDFPAADASFVRAEAEWRVPRRTEDLTVLARIREREAALRIFQRSYREALRLVDRCRELFRVSGDPHGEARSWIQLAAIRGYTGDSEDAIVALQTAKELVNAQKDPHLAFVVYSCLANDQAKIGRYSEAAKTLIQCRAYCKRLEHPLGALKVRWLDATIHQGTGHASTAETIFLLARDGYAGVEEFSALGMVSLDLAILYAEQGRWASARETAADAVPIIESQRLHAETLAAVRLLAHAVEAGNVPWALLRQVREAVLKDPLYGL